MKLWLLRPINPEAGPWEPWFDKTFGLVIRAETEKLARSFPRRSNGNGVGDECSRDYTTNPIKYINIPWEDETLTSCIELRAQGEEDLIIHDYAAA